MTQRDASAHICHYEQIYKEVAFIRRPDVQLWRQQRLRGNVPALPTGVRSEWNRELLFSLVHTAQMGTCRQIRCSGLEEVPEVQHTKIIRDKNPSAPQTETKSTLRLHADEGAPSLTRLWVADIQ
ncbi:hypothetical protein F2P81_015563 [Scophthalmus maximus]|uniref:Uncharacterized protein n=1 Tax=Scophthalmus maximus TaxID=52904 RepID=A0A6A4SGL1_SCOMX|nr:hypothetical protein F2P81_015563 [Scophthalmus maximus]